MPSTTPGAAEGPRPREGTLAVRPLTPTFGVEVLGPVPAPPYPDDFVRALVELLGTRLLVLFRGDEVPEALQDALTTALGARRSQDLNPWSPPLDPEAAVGREGILGPIPLLNKGSSLFFVNGPGLCETDPTAAYRPEDEARRGGASCWHTADTTERDVELVNILSPVIAPARDGDTLWCDTTAAYEALDDATKAEVEDLRVIHFVHFPPAPEGATFEMPPPTEPVDQPLVKMHPLTGRKYLYLNFNDMDRVVGRTRSESAALLRRLYDHIDRPRFVYRHRWRAGDLVLWNTNGTLHRRGVLDPAVPRALRRTQVAVPALQSTRARDRTREVTGHDGECWNPYPFDRS